MPFIPSQESNIRRFLDYKRKRGGITQIRTPSGDTLEGTAAEEYIRRYGSGQTEFERARALLAQEGSQAQTLEGIRQKGVLKTKEMDLYGDLAATQSDLERQRLINRGNLETEQIRQTGASERAVLGEGTKRAIEQAKIGRMDPRGFEYVTDINGNTQVFYMGRPFPSEGGGVPGSAAGERVNPVGLASRIYEGSGVTTPTTPVQRPRRKIVVDPDTGSVTQEPVSNRNSGGLLNRRTGGGFLGRSAPGYPAEAMRSRIQANTGTPGGPLDFRRMARGARGATSYLSNTFYQPARKAFRSSMRQLGY